MLVQCTEEGLAAALEQIAEGAGRPHRLQDALLALASVGALGIGLGGSSSWAQWSVVRSVSRADPVVGRIFDRHLEAVDLLVRLAPDGGRGQELAEVAAGRLVLGVWDDEPAPGQGRRAELREDAVSGVKVRAAGAGVVGRAVVPAHRRAATVLTLADVSARVEVDRAWAPLAGLPPSCGDRVELHGAPVCAVLADRESAEPALTSRARLRSCARWAGVVDAAAETALAALAGHPAPSAAGLAAGRIAAARRSLDLWLHDAARRADADPGGDHTALATELRATVAATARAILGEAVRTLGRSDGDLDRLRAELDQLPGMHRPDPELVAAGRELLLARRP